MLMTFDCLVNIKIKLKMDFSQNISQKLFEMWYY